MKWPVMDTESCNTYS